jgi:hypothetical protein
MDNKSIGDEIKIKLDEMKGYDADASRSIIDA